MELGRQFKDQATVVINVIVNSAVSFVEEQPYGSYLPIWKLNEAMGGLGLNFNLKIIQDRMAERGCTRGFYIVKGQGGQPAGMLIIDREATEAVAANYSRAPRPPRHQDRPAPAVPAFSSSRPSG